MEMCYNGELVMPQSFSVITADEMEYIDGGDAENFYNNIKGLWNSSANIRGAMKGAGISWGYIATCATMSYWEAIGFVAAKLGVTIALVSRTVAVIAGLGIVAVGTYLWFNRVFY